MKKHSLLLLLCRKLNVERGRGWDRRREAHLWRIVLAILLFRTVWYTAVVYSYVSLMFYLGYIGELFLLILISPLIAMVHLVRMLWRKFTT